MDRLRYIALCCAIALAACGPTTPSAPTRPDAQANSAIPAVPDPTAPGGAVPAPRPPASPAPPVTNGPSTAVPVAATADAPSLAVEAEGLRLFRGSGGSALPIAFGTPRDQTLRALAFRGPPATGTQQECPSGPLAFVAWPDGLKLYFQNDRFTGWALDPRARGVLATAAGVGPGVTRAAVEEAIVIKVVKSSLGTEFNSGGVYGLLDGANARSRVTDMWAGVGCVFR